MEGEIGFARLTLEQPDSAGRKPRANIEAAAVGEERRKGGSIGGGKDIVGAWQIVQTLTTLHAGSI